ncbi:MAG TPA: hypothetical protein VGQ08_11775 [Nitrospiraceae bacterium]|jgi:hypothetical protein|nr:hypothetical protein [Nitrospiraceae bacterium]
MPLKRTVPVKMNFPKSLYEHSSLYRLVSWLDSLNTTALKDRFLAPKIEAIIDFYRKDHGPSHRVRAAFNSLAAESKYGRVALRLEVGPVDRSSANTAIRDAIHELNSEQKAKIHHILKSGTDEEKVEILSEFPPKAITKGMTALQFRARGAISNPLFDLFLTIFDPEAMRRLNRCKSPACARYFVAWPGKKTYCSDFCRNRYWNRPRRREERHGTNRPRPVRPRTR